MHDTDVEPLPSASHDVQVPPTPITTLPLCATNASPFEGLLDRLVILIKAPSRYYRPAYPLGIISSMVKDLQAVVIVTDIVGHVYETFHCLVSFKLAARFCTTQVYNSPSGGNYCTLRLLFFFFKLFARRFKPSLRQLSARWTNYKIYRP